MKKLLLSFALFFSIFAFSQSQLTVLSAGKRAPIFNAKVSCNNKILGYTNTSGVINFKTKCVKVDVFAKGFNEDKVVVDTKMELVLAKEDKDTKNIEGIALDDKSDPRALRILNLVNDKYKENSQKSLESYSYKSYNKVAYDINTDSISDYRNFVARRNDSLQNVSNNLSAKKKPNS